MGGRDGPRITASLTWLISELCWLWRKQQGATTGKLFWQGKYPEVEGTERGVWSAWHIHQRPFQTLTSSLLPYFKSSKETWGLSMTGKYLVDLNSPTCFIPPIEIVCFQHRHLYSNLLISVFEGFIPFKDFFFGFKVWSFLKIIMIIITKKSHKCLLRPEGEEELIPV